MDSATGFVERLRAGEDSAWLEFARTHGRLIFAAARRAGLRQPDMEEALQATSVAVYRALPSLRDPASLTSWTYSIAFRSAVKMRRRQGREVSAESDENNSLLDIAASQEPSPEDAAIRIDEAGRLHEGLASLSPACRRLVEALYFQTPPPSYQEISDQLDLPIGSIGPTRARCLEKLKQAVSSVSRRQSTRTSRETPGARRSKR